MSSKYEYAVTHHGKVCLKRTGTERVMWADGQHKRVLLQALNMPMSGAREITLDSLWAVFSKAADDGHEQLKRELQKKD